MNYTIEFENHPVFLGARVTGKNSADTVRQYMEDVLRECERTGCRRVLINECLEGPRLSILEVFELLSQGSRLAMGKFRAIAFIDETMGETAEFAEDVAVNRGVPIRFFDNIEAASQWLVDDHNRSTMSSRADTLAG